MSEHKLCCVGYITKDRVITPQKAVDMPGGTAYYFAEAIRHLSTDGFQLVTAVEESQLPVVDDMRSKGIDVFSLPTRQSVCFENIYGDNLNDRRQRVTALPDPFTVEGLSAINADVVHLGSLLHDDFPLDVIRHLSSHSLLCADVQGFLREVRGQEVCHTDWDEKHEALKYIHTLKANEQEMEVVTGADDPHEAALTLADWGVREVLLTLGDKGSLIYTRGQFHDIPAYPTMKIVDATGCGDTYMAGYLYMRGRGADYDEAGRFAAAMCTIKLQGYGPFSGTEQAIRAIMSSHAPLL